MTGRGYRAVAGRVRTGLDEIKEIAARTERIWSAGRSEADDWYVDAVALNLHGFHAGVERLLELIAEAVDEAKPVGSDWHRALLSQMAAEIPDVRPPVLGTETRKLLDRYCGFRHVVRNVYSFNLDPQQVGLLVAGLPEALWTITADLGSFADWLTSIADVGSHDT